MLGAFPSGYEQDRAATHSIGQKHESHYPILAIHERIGHCRRMRDEEQSPRPKRNGLRTTLIPRRPGNLRHVGQETKAVAKREHCERNIRDSHPADVLTSPTVAAVTSGSFEPCGENEQPKRDLN